MEKDIGKIRKNDQTEILVRIDDFGGRPGLTIREFITSDRYTGFTKAGTRIPADKFEDFKAMIDSINASDFPAASSEEGGAESGGGQAELSGESESSGSEGGEGGDAGSGAEDY